ncbi:cation:proton antiporter [Streptomyces iakyrus]|uniref:cation:proton antiporter domain-containing protein n=1 Tax=Streptomyces iakyrus TaxID=68219 RepID=UPI00068B8041|nr:cation:proton antiporter [Streptomyces iakyrus]
MAAVALTGVLPLAVIVLVAVIADGTALDVPGTAARPEAGAGLHLGSTGHFFLAAAVVVAAAHLGGALAKRLGQPRVIGEICAGLALGPSLLGNLAPDITTWLFPHSALGPINGLAQIGLVLFMFGVGQELAGMRLRGTAARAFIVSQSSMLVPFALGAAVAVPLAARYAGPHGNGIEFVLFMGCALSITAFPVLARLLSDLGITRTEPGRLSLFAAAVGDGTSWLVLAAILAAAHGSDPTTLLLNGVAAVAAVALFLGPVKRLLARWAEHKRSSEAGALVLVVGVTGAAALTAAIGVHQLIGALLVGLAWPVRREGAFDAGPTVERLTDTARTVLLPFFFFGFGLTVDLSTLGWSASLVAVFLALLALATFGKIAGPGLAAWLSGMRPGPAFALGVLLNARGLTELIVIQIGYDAGIIDARMLAILTLVALATTMMTRPLLRLFRSGLGTGELVCSTVAYSESDGPPASHRDRARS